MGKSYAVRIRTDCERYDFRLRRRVLDILDSRGFSSIDECIRFIDESLKSDEFVSKYYGYRLRLEVLEDIEVKLFVATSIGWHKEVDYVFSSDENILPLKDEYYHKAQGTSIWGPAPEW